MNPVTHEEAMLAAIECAARSPIVASRLKIYIAEQQSIQQSAMAEINERRDRAVRHHSEMEALAARADALAGALRPFAEKHGMGDNYVQFHPRLIEAARKALATPEGRP